MEPIATKSGVTRIDALTDGVFAIVATLLVLDVKLPDTEESYPDN